MRLHKSASAGFTLIELLVVIATIAILIGMLLPSLSSARDSARSVQCLASMRSLGIAMSLYLDDNSEVFPRSKHSAGFNSGLTWAPQMFAYLTDHSFEGDSDLWQSDSWWNATNEFYRCAHDQRESPIEHPGLPFSTAAISYGLNVYYELRKEEIDPSKYAGNRFEPYRKRASIPHPSGTILLGEIKDTMSIDHIMAHFWRTRAVEAGFEVAYNRHGDNAGYLMLDGSAKSHTLIEVYDATTTRDRWDPAKVK